LASVNIADNSGACTILVDDPYDISIADSADVVEGGSASFAVTITPAVVTGDTVTVDFNTVDGTALAGSDYTAASGG
jgi:type IV pilus assembly protein PilY1